MDERVAEHLATEEVSIGDFVLCGGELPAALIVDAVTRLLPGALGNEASSQNESFSLLERAEQSETGALHKTLSANHACSIFRTTLARRIFAAGGFRKS